MDEPRDEFDQALDAAADGEPAPYLVRPRVLAKVEEYAAGHAEVVLLTGRRRTRRWLREATAERTG